MEHDHHDHEKDGESKKEKKGPGKKELTLLRARLAQERTLMAWIRTAATFMTFGFAIAKLLESRIRETEVHPILDVISPKMIAVIMFMTGLIGLVLATNRYINNQALLSKHHEKVYFNIVLLQSYIIMALLILLLIGAFTTTG